MGIVYSIIYYMSLPFSAFHALFNAIPGVRKLGTISVPMRIAMLVFLFLFVMLVSFCLSFWLSGSRAQWSDYLLNWTAGPTVLVLMILIPVVSYYVVKIWLEEDTSAYPDIDKAWRQGIEALDKHGISIATTPLFLVIGNADDRRAENLMKASGFGFNVSNPAEGPAALHWFANPESIFVFCTQTSSLSKLADRYKNNIVGGRGGRVSSISNAPPITGGQTIVAGDIDGGLIGERPAIDQTMGEEDDQKFMDAPAQMGGIGATMQFGGGGGPGQTMVFEAGAAAAPIASAVNQSASELTDQMERLEYVCGLITKARQPVCPLNGILALLPFDMIEDASDPIQRAVHSDLETIRNKTRLRCSVTALVTEMESEPGFMELIRRVGTKRAKEQRFGKGYNPWNPRLAEQLEAVSQHATGAFEDWTYLLFREKDGLRRPGNPKLFELLCKVRGKFSECLGNVLANSFGYQPDKDPRAAGNSLLFCGCYFAATGDSEDRQAFVRSVVYRMMEQEGELDWNEDALADNQNAEFAASVATLIGGVGFIFILGLVVNHFFHDYLPWSGE